MEDVDRLITCPDCGKTVSKRAVTCPHCGCPVVEATSGQIHVRRGFSSLGGGSGAAISVWLDGSSKGEIREEGQSLSVTAPPGRHVVEVKTKEFSASCQVDVITGSTVELEGGFSSFGALQIGPPRPGSSCVIATACVGPASDELSLLRRIRDVGISANPIVRDFFHVFWSRYYEYSPGMARLAERDADVRRHLRWSFLDPWMAWLELVMEVGFDDLRSISPQRQMVIHSRLASRIECWLAELPQQLEGKQPANQEQVRDAFEEFRTLAAPFLSARGGSRET